jgi:hypothetical protein
MLPGVTKTWMPPKCSTRDNPARTIGIVHMLPPIPMYSSLNCRLCLQLIWSDLLPGPTVIALVNDFFPP